MEKKEYIISADSACDLPEGYAKAHGIEIVTLATILDGVEYETLDNHNVLQYVKDTGEIPKTAAPSIELLEEFFAKLSKQAEHVIHFSMSSGISSTYNNAVKAAEKFENVTVIDSQSLSSGIALQVMNAEKLIAEGNTFEQVIEGVRQAVGKTRASFVIDSLKLLYKGGRCSKLALFGANLMKIKPSIVVKNGTMCVGKKYRKNIKLVAQNYVADQLNNGEEKDMTNCFITYTTFDKPTVDILVQMAKDAGFKNVYTSIASATITCHCGANTIGILYIAK